LRAGPVGFILHPCSAEGKELEPSRRTELLKRSGAFLAGAALFSLAYTQSPLYGPNQDQYFLHGLARAGYGFLSRDWLAGTLDPTPLFSLLVEAVYRLAHWPPAFFLVYAVLLGVYFFSAIGIAGEVFPFRTSASAKWLVALAVLALHSALFRAAVARALPGWGGYLFEDGLAEQRILGSVFQPSAFGVLLVVSLFFFLKRRPYAAVLCAVAAAAFHPTYLLPAALVVAGYLADWLWIERRPALAVRAGALALLCSLPVAAYAFSVFAGSSPADLAESYRLLVHERIPHHAVLAYWWNAGDYLKLVLVALALVVVRRSRLFPVLLIPALGGAALTAVQLASGSDALALLFPWRISAVLVPLASVLLAAAAVGFLLRRRPLAETNPPLLRGAAAAGMFLLAAAGTVKFSLESAEFAAAPEAGLYAFVRANHLPEDVYLVPPKMEGFRLAAGSPVYVDFKSIPYKDLDVLEWYRRMRVINRLYWNGDCSAADGLLLLRAANRLVLPVDDFPLGCPGWVEIYRDDSYGLYEPADRD
jgi:hypothetical protein